MPLPVERAERRVRRRGLPSQRGRERKYSIMIVAIRCPLMMSEAGKRTVESSLTSPVCFLTLLHGELSPAFCPTDVRLASSHPTTVAGPRPRASQAWVCVTLQDWHTLQESRGKKHAFLVGNKKAVCIGGTMPAFSYLHHLGWRPLMFPYSVDEGRA